MHTGEGKKKAKEIKRRGASLLGWSKSAGKGEQVVKSVTSPQAHWDPVGIIPEVHTLFCTGTLRALGPLLKALSATRAGSGFPALCQTWENLMQLNGRHRKEVRNENDAKPTSLHLYHLPLRGQEKPRPLLFTSPCSCFHLPLAIKTHGCSRFLDAHTVCVVLATVSTTSHTFSHVDGS